MAMTNVIGLSKKSILWIGVAAVAGLSAITLSYGSVEPVPSVVPGHITDDTALYQKLSEIKVRKERNPSFDEDLKKLASTESRYHERLPLLSSDTMVHGPMARIQQTKYHYVGARKSAQASTTN